MLPETLVGNEAAENDLTERETSDSASKNVEGPKEDAPLENKVEITVDEAINQRDKETNSRVEGENAMENVEEPKIGAQLVDEEKSDKNEEIRGDDEVEKATTVENDDGNTILEEINGEYMEESDHNTSEDTEIDDQEDMWEDDEDVLWEDDEENSDEDSEETAADEDVVSEEEGTEEEDDEEEEENAEEEKYISKGDGVEAEEHNAEKVVANLKNVKKTRGRSRKKKAKEESPKKLESGDEPESSRKRKVKKRMKSMGMIFMCNSKTKNDCYQYKVLGLPQSKKDMVEKIYPGMRLFLYDVDLKLMYGIYKAVGHGGYNIKPKAFNSQFPSQVRFTVLRDCLPLAEEKFKKLIKENYFTKNKFDCQLNSEQVKELCKLFVSTSKGRRPRKLGESLKAEKPPPMRRDRTRRRGADKRQPAMREEYRYPDRPRKRLRKVISSMVRPRQPLPAPLPSAVHLLAYERNSDVDIYRRDLYSGSRDRYRNRRDPLSRRDPYHSRGNPPSERRDPYPDRRDPYTDRRDPYPERQDPYLDRRDPYRDGRDPYLERRDPYREGRGPYAESLNPYREGRDSYSDRRDPYRLGLDPYLGSRDAYRDDRVAYVDRHGPYKDDPRSDLYSSYRRDSLSDRRDVYREDRGIPYRDSYRLEELPPLNSETTQHRDVATRDTYASHRGLPPYTERLYSAEYPSSSGLAREYRL